MSMNLGKIAWLPALALVVSACTAPIERVWEFPTSSPIYSTPLVVDELIVFGSESGTLYAVDKLGQSRWQYSAPSAEIFSRPATDGKLIFFGATNQTLYAVDKIGKLIWQFTANERIKSDPLVHEGTVYISSYDGHVYALDAATGKPVWQYPPTAKPAPAPAEPPPAEGADGGQPTAPTMPASAVITPKEFSYSAPVIKDGVLFIGNLDGYLYALLTADGSLKWRFATDGGVTSTALIDGGVVYFGSKDDCVYAIDAATGTQVKWKFKTGGDVLSSPVLADGVIYIGSDDKNFYAIDAQTGQEKCHFTTAGEVISYGAVYQDLIAFGGGQGDGSVYVLEREGCKPFFKFKTGYKIESDPVFSGSEFYITSGDRKLYAFKVNKTVK